MPKYVWDEGVGAADGVQPVFPVNALRRALLTAEIERDTKARFRLQKCVAAPWDSPYPRQLWDRLG